MNICLVMSHPFRGTTSLAYYEYASELARQGHVVTAVCAHLAREDNTDWSTQEVDGVRVYSKALSSMSKKSISPSLFGFETLRLLRRISKVEHFDILQLKAFPNWGAILFPWGGPYARATILDVRSPAVSSIALTRASRYIIRAQSKLYKNVTVLDTSLAESIFGTHGRRMATMPLGANMRRFTPDGADVRHDIGIQPDELVMVYVGSINMSRSVADITEAYSRFQSRYPDSRLMMVGGGDLLQNLRRSSSATGFRDRIIFTGPVPYSDVPLYIRAADIGIAYIPDNITYRFQPPLKTVEYLACGVPTIATNTSGNRLFVKDGINGVLVPASVDGLSSGMLKLSMDDDFRQALTLQARPSVQRHSYEVIVREQIVPYYQQCLASNQEVPNCSAT